MATMQQQQQHVVAVPLPAQGHLNPLMRFCTVLASHGVLVTFVNIDPVHHRIQEVMGHEQPQPQPQPHEQNAHSKQQEQLQDVDLNTPIRCAHIPIHGLDLANDFRVSLEPFFEAQNSITPHLEQLILQLNRQGPAVTCIVSDFFMTAPTQKVADKLNIPRVAFCPSSASLLLLFHYVTQGEPTSTAQVLEALSRSAERSEVIWEGLPGLPTIYRNDAPAFKHVVDDTSYMWKLCTNACQESFRRTRAVVFNSFEDLEAPAFMALSKHLSLPIYGVGPLVEPLLKEKSTSLWKEDEACILWLDQQPALSVLYISFGSVTLLSQPQFEEIVAGLLSSQQRFLWVFRPDLVENVESSKTFVSDVLSRSDGKGYVVDWAPQLRVLAHPSVGGFLTHCGWNSTMEAVAHGVPMLCWPYFADQQLNAKYAVEEWKVGLRCEASCKEDGNGRGGCVERGEVERVMRALMEGEEGGGVRKKAQALKEAGCRSLEAGGSSHTNLEALITSLAM